MSEPSDDLEGQIATFCHFCDGHTAGRRIGRVVKCMECGTITEDDRQRPQSEIGDYK